LISVLWGSAAVLLPDVLLVAGFELPAAAASAGAAADMLLYCLKMLRLAAGAVDLRLPVDGLQDS
jgi:hypothetical protein